MCINGLFWCLSCFSCTYTIFVMFVLMRLFQSDLVEMLNFYMYLGLVIRLSHYAFEFFIFEDLEVKRAI